MYALRRFSTLLKDERFTKTDRGRIADLSKRLKDECRGHTNESPRELARQSEANVC